MAKSKSRKNQKSKQNAENEVLIYIYALVMITISLIGALKIGFIGQLTSSIVCYFVGNLYGIIYLAVIVFSIMLITKKSVKEVPIKYAVGISSLLTAWLIAASIPKDPSIKGFDVLTVFLNNSELILKGELAQGGGLFGSFLVALCTFLFDYTGTWIVIAALIMLGVLVMANRMLANGFHKMRKTIHSANTDKKPKKPKAKKQPEIVTEEPKRKEPIVGSISIDERVKRGRVFLDVDELEPPEDELSFLDETPVQLEAVVKEEQEEKTEEDKSVIEEIIGKEDTFVSSFSEDYSKYRLPRLNLLKETGRQGKSVSNVKAANECGRKLIEILDEFGVKATLIATHIGPAVTKFEVKPDLGVRVNKISNLQHDIKMALAAKDIRIEAPIPGKSAVGIEIPNVEKTMVGMKELMRSIPDTYEEKKMLFCLGKDLMGNCIYGELNKMPHLLIAGATGSGKSVCVNSIITSILLRAKPNEVKMLLVDPKKVEFTPYQKIPHLIGPVITDGEEANRALKVIVNMMDNRYELFSMAGVRNIAGYNAYIEKHPEEGLQKMPWIVVIIDELADLMLVAAKEVESSIQRITQLARAAGIHLIVATQRPSVDVITGVIKANIPSRIAFAVSSAVDSRTILDQMGAEKLMGNGDMLYIPVGETVPTRVQGVFVSDDEVNAVAQYVSTQAKPKFDDAFLRLEMLDGSIGPTQSATDDDPLYEEVKEFIIETRRASTSLIQRKFSIGYARAARLIDLLEERNIVGPARGSKPREVYAKAADDAEE